MLIFQHMGQTFPNRMAEWTLAAILTSWGILLLLPDHTFELSTTYASMASWAPEEVWGFGCLAIGLTRLIALFINGIWVPPTYYLRSITSFVSVFFWFSITYGIASAGTASTGLAVYPWLLILEFFCLHRTGRDYRLALIEKS